MLTFVPNLGPPVLVGAGQILITSSSQFVVPEGVTSLCAVCVGPGAKGGTYSQNNRHAGGGGGGALVYVNSIPVTPGEILDIVVGRSSLITAVFQAVSAIITSISRNGVVLMSATSGRIGRNGTLETGIGQGGFGGTWYVHPSFTDFGGGNGGNGGAGGQSSGINEPSAGAGGGAGGYGDAGGDGGRGGTGSVNSAGNPTGGKRGGGGGGKSRATINSAKGGGVGLQGEGASGLPITASTSNVTINGNPGSLPAPTFGGGGTYPNVLGEEGGCRIIWGTGRRFPATDTQDK